jgi:hypothetical protein
LLPPPHFWSISNITTVDIGARFRRCCAKSDIHLGGIEHLKHMPRFNGAMRPRKITFGEMRSAGVRGMLISCADHKCSHSVAATADRWPDEVRLSDIERRFVCGKTRRGCSAKFSLGKIAGWRHGLSIVSWSLEFDDPIEAPDGTRLNTLREAVAYLAKTVPKSERDVPAVTTAAEMLTYAAEREPAWMFLARMATLQAIHRHEKSGSLTPAPKTIIGENES